MTRALTSHAPSAEALLSSMQLCMRYGVSVKSFDVWKRRPDFPQDALTYTRGGHLWDHTKIDAWLRARPINKTGPEPRWRKLVGHLSTGGKASAKAGAHP